MSAILRTDEELTRQLAAGEDAAFDELYRRYAGPLGAYAGRMLRDRAAGEDVAQTSLMNAYAALSRGTQPRHVKAWLYRIAHNAALETIERRRDVPSELEHEGSLDRASETRDLRETLLSALQTLPERQRRAYVLREVNGLKVGEIAVELELRVEQVEQALFAARNKLAEYLAFGDRLDCATVGTLRAADLGGIQRRAVKAHVRACPACRSELTLGGKLAAFSPVGFLGALKDAVAGFFASGAGPIAAKVGAVVVVGALAAATPGTARKIAHVFAGMRAPAASAASLPEGDATVAEPTLFVLPGFGPVRPSSLFVPSFLQPPAPPVPVDQPPADAPPIDPGAPTDPTPLDTTPGDTTPTDTTPADTTPTDTTPADTTPTDTTPADTTPTDTPPADTTPTDTTPTDTTPADTTPADTTPVDTTPVDTTPVDTTPVDTTPVDTTPTPPA
jgi:RNA polymerase sigma factor (sigma-70 family)